MIRCTLEIGHALYGQITPVSGTHSLLKTPFKDDISVVHGRIILAVWAFEDIILGVTS